MSDSAVFADDRALVDVALTVGATAHVFVAAARSVLKDVTHATETKSSEVDPVTVVDTASEQLIADLLARLRPGDGLLGEEGHDREPKDDEHVTWIVDPIDGTVNFLYGIPAYAVSIAAVDHRGEIVCGVVAHCATGQLWVARHGGGAATAISPHFKQLVDQHVAELTARQGDAQELIDDLAKELAQNPVGSDVLDSWEFTDLSVTQPTSLAVSLLATGFSYLPARRTTQMQLIGQLIHHVRDIRRGGSAALDLCYVAEGLIDCYVEHGLNPWDWAAGALIAKEAGARIELPSLTSRAADGDVVWVAAETIADDFEALLRENNGLAALPAEN